MTTITKSGVRLAADYRDNLIVDRYHPDLATMRGSKRERLRSENSEDALTWNVFQSLNQIDPGFWLPLLMQKAFPEAELPAPQMVIQRLWQDVAPPPSLRLHQGDEGPSEIDVVIETERIVWFIEAKFKSDISTGTTNNPERDQITRNLDVGSWYAGARDFYLALLILDECKSARGVEVVKSMRRSLPRLAHRPDGLKNARPPACLRWSQVAEVLRTCAERVPREDERPYAARAHAWMKERRIV